MSAFVWLHRQVESWDGEASIRKIVELARVPCIGELVAWTTEDGDTFNARVEDVELFEETAFVDLLPIEIGRDQGVTLFEELALHQKDGWLLDGEIRSCFRTAEYSCPGWSSPCTSGYDTWLGLFGPTDSREQLSRIGTRAVNYPEI